MCLASSHYFVPWHFLCSWKREFRRFSWSFYWELLSLFQRRQAIPLYACSYFFLRNWEERPSSSGPPFLFSWIPDLEGCQNPLSCPWDLSVKSQLIFYSQTNFLLTSSRNHFLPPPRLCIYPSLHLQSNFLGSFYPGTHICRGRLAALKLPRPLYRWLLEGHTRCRRKTGATRSPTHT